MNSRKLLAAIARLEAEAVPRIGRGRLHLYAPLMALVKAQAEELKAWRTPLQKHYPIRPLADATDAAVAALLAAEGGSDAE